MGQAVSPDLPPEGFCIERAQHRSSNAALTAARYHSRSSKCSFADWYKVESGKALARSKHSKILRARGSINERLYAVKMYQRWAMPEEAQGLLAAEVEIHLALSHPNIVRLYDVFEAPNDMVYLVMEHCSGGELFQELAQKGHFSEVEAAEAAWQMASAVSYLHSHGVAHRDIKLENFLYADREKTTLKLIDFGFSKVWDDRNKMLATCGTPDYVSPEVLTGSGYTSQCDMWSLGVVVFMLLSGRAPLHAEGREALHQKILAGEVDWEQLEKHGTLSPEALDFLRSLLVVDPSLRMDAAKALCHPWLLQTQVAQSILVHAGIIQSLRRYANGPPLRRAVLQLVAQHLAQNEVQELTNLFLSLAAPSTGTINTRGIWEEEDPRLRLLSVLDVNQDGEVYYSEFLAAAISSLPHLGDEVLREVFGRLDLANTGYVGAEELWTVFGDTFEGLDAETLMSGISLFTNESGGYMDFEAFKNIIEDRDEGLSPADEPCLPAFFPAPRSPDRQSSWSRQPSSETEADHLEQLDRPEQLTSFWGLLATRTSVY